jgi:hypothetical protein
VIAAQQRAAEGSAVVGHAANRDAAETDTVKATLAADEQVALAFATRAPVGECDLQRSVHRLRAAVDEEHAVQARRRESTNALGEFERAGMPDLKARREIERVDLSLHRFGDARMPMPGADAPQARRAVEHLAALGRSVGDALRRCHEPRRSLELPVRRERHPEGVGAGFHRWLRRTVAGRQMLAARCRRSCSWPGDRT